MRVITLNRKQIVPYKELGEDWIDLAVWWPDHVLLWGSELAGRVLLDEVNRLAIIPVVRFKTTQDTVSIKSGLEWLISQGFSPEIIDISQMTTYPIPRKRVSRKQSEPEAE